MTPEEAAQFLLDVGFVDWQVVVMGAIGFAESGLDPHAVHLNDHDPTSLWYLSVDFGAWQINDAANQVPLITRGIMIASKAVSQQLLDPLTNARAARAVFLSRGGDRNPLAGYAAWSTFKSGAYQEFRPAAWRAARAVGAV